MKLTNLRSITLNVTNSCNLNCVYCYEKFKNNKYMSLDTMKKAVDEYNVWGDVSIDPEDGKTILPSLREFIFTAISGRDAQVLGDVVLGNTENDFTGESLARAERTMKAGEKLDHKFWDFMIPKK